MRRLFADKNILIKISKAYIDFQAYSDDIVLMEDGVSEKEVVSKRNMKKFISSTISLPQISGKSSESK